MITFIIKGNKKYYDIETMRTVLKVPRTKIQRELKKQDAEIVKYKNLHLYQEATFFNLMELIIIEKLSKIDD
jgi:hypothetical protein